MKSNLFLAIRNIARNKVNSIITITGLAVAFACLLLIFTYVSQEFSYNSFHQNKDKIYRLNYSAKLLDGTEHSSLLFNHELATILKDKVPQVSHCTAFRSAHGPTLVFENQKLEENVCIAESDFFQMFSFNIRIGNVDELFKNPNEIVISSTLADKFQAIDACSDEELIGKSVFFSNDTGNIPFVISGIMADVPEISSIQFDAIIPYKYENAFSQSDNMFGNSSIFYEINQREDALIAEKLINTIIIDHYENLVESLQSKKILANTKGCFVPFSISINDTYLHEINSDYEINNSRSSLFFLSIIGLIILIIACTNLVMLSLGQTFKKIREIGIRKAIGAKPVQIFNLFVNENIILALSGFVLGLLLCVLILPLFNQLAKNGIIMNLINIPEVVVFVFSILTIIVLATSTVPILQLAKKRINLLSKQNMKSSNKTGSTQMFVTIQYVLSICLIILTIAIVRQTNFMKYKNLGFSTENIIDLRMYHLNTIEKTALYGQLRSNPGIENLTLTDRNYVSGRSSHFVKNKSGEMADVRILNVDHNYISTLSLNIIQGEDFTETNSGEGSIIINEKLLSFLGYEKDAIGKIISLSGRDHQIVGVVKDFNFDSTKEGIAPLMLTLRKKIGGKVKFAFIKYHPALLSQLLPFIQKTWKTVAPDKEFDLKFWDSQLNDRYQAEERWSQIIGYAALIAIIISSLGLFGLTSLVINRRVKEIGIRKVNGAKISEILSLLNKNFIKWVAIAFVIACPVAYYAMSKWLENFAYKISLSWWIFVLAGVLSLGIALLTVTWQSWQAATRNPVEALRYE